MTREMGFYEKSVFIFGVLMSLVFGVFLVFGFDYYALSMGYISNMSQFGAFAAGGVGLVFVLSGGAQYARDRYSFPILLIPGAMLALLGAAWAEGMWSAMPVVVVGLLGAAVLRARRNTPSV